MFLIQVSHGVDDFNNFAIAARAVIAHTFV